MDVGILPGVTLPQQHANAHTLSRLRPTAGGKKDSWLIDYTATKNSLDVARASGAKHFVLLSAICVQKPLLEFQKAKLQFESDLQVGDRGHGDGGEGGGGAEAGAGTGLCRDGARRAERAHKTSVKW